MSIARNRDKVVPWSAFVGRHVCCKHSKTLLDEVALALRVLQRCSQYSILYRYSPHTQQKIEADVKHPSCDTGSTTQIHHLRLERKRPRLGSTKCVVVPTTLSAAYIFNPKQDTGTDRAYYAEISCRRSKSIYHQSIPSTVYTRVMYWYRRVRPYTINSNINTPWYRTQLYYCNTWK